MERANRVVNSEEDLVPLAEKVVAGNLLAGNALRKLEAISHTPSDDDVDKEATAEQQEEQEDLDRPLTVGEFQRMLNEAGESKSYSGISPLDMTPSQLKAYERDQQQASRERARIEYRKQYKPLPTAEEKAAAEEKIDETVSLFPKNSNRFYKSALDMDREELADFEKSHKPES